jgi:hypothetical protein
MENEIDKRDIVLRFGRNTCEKDIEDLKILLTDIRERYNFDWYLDSYRLKEKKREEEVKMKADIKIQHSNPEISKEIREVLEEEQRKGNLTFNMETRRKCDFCERTLTENDDFESFGGLDKCKSCIEGDK